ncbi:MAG: ATP-dependent Clp protease adaptor ClpS [Bacteroidales bacterium]|nr:ATP-dependent Clp protease adaptor ClpS [Bacteroidales bacterium]
MIKEKKQEQHNFDIYSDDFHNLILLNDDYNTFEFVIETLMEVCKHSSEQAEQCALITHYKGRCCIKKERKQILELMNNEINTRGLNSIIE